MAMIKKVKRRKRKNSPTRHNETFGEERAMMEEAAAAADPDDELATGPAYPAFMGRVSSSSKNQRRKSHENNNANNASNATKNNNVNGIINLNSASPSSKKRGNKFKNGEGTEMSGKDLDADLEDEDEEDEEDEDEDAREDQEEEKIANETRQHRLDGCSIASISRAIFRDIRVKKQGLSEEDLVKLEYIFGENHLGRALDVAASGGVTRFVGKKSRRTVYAVRATASGGGGGGGKMKSPTNIADGGTKGQQQHLTYPDHFCACKGFAWDIISRDERLMCKHMLAAALAESVDGCDEVEMDDIVFANLLAREMLE
jgi:hypothetical protein